MFVLGFSLLVQCTNSGNQAAKIVSPSTETITVEVDYMPGAEPYTDTLLEENSLWNFFQNNVSQLFDNTKTISVPLSLSQMEEVPAGQTNYDVNEILALAAEHRDLPEFSGSTASIYILFLDGFFEDDGESQTNVLGVSLSGTSIIALFKPVVANGTFPIPFLQGFVEQSVLVHEFGHAIGLVNNGIPLESDHHDAENGAHCTNRSCIMYYLNEGLADLRDFINSGETSTDRILFGQECLDDVAALLD